MTAALGIIHGLDYLFSHWLVGSIVFNFFVLPAGGPSAKEIDQNRYQYLILPTFISSLSWMILSSYGMAESWMPSELWTAMTQTSFGHLWCIRIILLFILLVSLRKLQKHRLSSKLLIIFALVLPLFSVLSGHAGSQADNTTLRVSVDYIHSLAVAIWTGGLWSLMIWLKQRLALSSVKSVASFQVVKRFSHFAIISTLAIGISGLTMAYFAGVSLADPWATLYGKFIAMKLGLFTVVIGIASMNQFIHLKKWTPERERQFILGVYRESRRELVLIIVIFGIAGFLARTALPTELAF